MPTLTRLTALVVVVVVAAACGASTPGAAPRSPSPEVSVTPTPADVAAGHGQPPSATAVPRARPHPSSTGAAAASPSPAGTPSTDQQPTVRPEPQPPRTAVRTPMRAAWVHLFDSTLKSRAGIADLVDELAVAGATAVIAQVARRHDAYYASDVLPRTGDPELEPGLDVLAELTTRAHAAGLEVHAWFGVAPTWHGMYDDIPAPAGWLTAEHGPDAPEGQRWVTREHGGGWSDYLDPALPQVREHAAAVAVEIAERYPVDGVHLDYVRYASERHGYHPDALARYRAETGARGTPEPGDPAWKEWRRQQTRALVAHVAGALEAGGHDVMLSAAVIAWGGITEDGGFASTRTANEALQDWQGWVVDGLLDAVMPMNYFRAVNGEQAQWFAQWLAYQRALAAASDTLVVPGVAGYLNSPAAALEQVHAATRGTDGAVMYSYQQPTEDGSRAIWALLAESDWGAPAP